MSVAESVIDVCLTSPRVKSVRVEERGLRVVFTLTVDSAMSASERQTVVEAVEQLLPIVGTEWVWESDD